MIPGVEALVLVDLVLGIPFLAALALDILSTVVLVVLGLIDLVLAVLDSTGLDLVSIGLDLVSTGLDLVDLAIPFMADLVLEASDTAALGLDLIGSTVLTTVVSAII
jgi:hypothetical protein